MLRQLKKYLDSEIFDIILYGSSVKGAARPRDIDVLVVFRKGSLRERLDRLQAMKKGIRDKVDMKQVLLEELFSAAFLARTGVMLEGVSARTGKPFSESLGFRAYTLFWYSLSGLTHTEKVKFNYVLAGRNSEGVLKSLGAVRLVGGVVKVPISRSLELEEVLKRHRIDYKKKNILEEK